MNLKFLEAHHADLKAAVELAGPNLGSGQATWHRVYRAANRRVRSDEDLFGSGGPGGGRAEAGKTSRVVAGVRRFLLS